RSTIRAFAGRSRVSPFGVYCGRSGLRNGPFLSTRFTNQAHADVQMTVQAVKAAMTNAKIMMETSMKFQRLAARVLVMGLLFNSAAIVGLRAEIRAPVYVVIEADEITDAEGFRESYIKLIPPGVVETKFADGRVLALSQNITALDGPAPKFIAILAF